MKRHIFFVDDDPNVLQGLRRMLRPMRQEWDMVFAESGHRALELLAHTPCDVVVSDVRMPGMDGVQLLTEVMQRYPNAVRIILSGHADREMTLKAVGPTHQYLAKPCDAELLKTTVARACMLRHLLADEPLRQLITGIQILPSLPSLYVEVLKAVQAPERSLETIGKLITQDMGMTTKLLQLVNSAFFGPHRHVCSPIQAVELLGPDIVQALALSPQVFRPCDQAAIQSLGLDSLWDHSMAVGICAKMIARGEDCEPEIVQEAFIAGLLHDVGKLVFATHLPELYGRARSLVQAEGMTDWEAERAMLGATHTEVGAYLLGLWGLPSRIVEALAYHHQPRACPDQAFSSLTAVHVADALLHETASGYDGEGPASIDQDYLAQLGLHHRLPDWRNRCQVALQDAQHA